MHSFVSFCSNLGYALISRVLAEKFAGNDYEGWVQRNILIPLGMRNTGFNLDRYVLRQRHSFKNIKIIEKVCEGSAPVRMNHYHSKKRLGNHKKRNRLIN